MPAWKTVYKVTYYVWCQVLFHQVLQGQTKKQMHVFFAGNSLQPSIVCFVFCTYQTQYTKCHFRGWCSQKIMQLLQMTINKWSKNVDVVPLLRIDWPISLHSIDDWVNSLVGSLTSLFSTNMAILETTEWSIFCCVHCSTDFQCFSMRQTTPKLPITVQGS